jgi:hypothetical protein
VWLSGAGPCLRGRAARFVATRLVSRLAFGHVAIMQPPTERCKEGSSRPSPTLPQHVTTNAGGAHFLVDLRIALQRPILLQSPGGGVMQRKLVTVKATTEGGLPGGRCAGASFSGCVCGICQASGACQRPGQEG